MTAPMTTATPSVKPKRKKRRDPGTILRYAYVLIRDFRWSLLAVAVVVLAGGFLYWITPHPQLGGERPTVLFALYASWMSLFAQPPFTPPAAWYLQIVAGVYPILGVMLIGEGLVRFALLMVSRRRGEKEWMQVSASTYRDHVILCGLGHLGYRVLQQLVAQGQQVVAIEKDANAMFLDQARATNVPILIRDMRDDQALVDAGVKYARVILIATNDDMANVEVALDARRMNPSIRVAMRLFDQKMATKLQDAFSFDFAFSASALAAPTVAAMALDCRVVSAFAIGDVPHVTAEVDVAAGSLLAGQSVAQIEAGMQARVLARLRGGVSESPARADLTVAAGDILVVNAAAEHIADIAAAGRRS